jgi:eukaryotic-like serine/threonine-protein kinase
MPRRRPTSVTAPLKAQTSVSRESRIGNYHVLAPLARGGMSGVYLAEHLVTREHVALKVIDPFYAGQQEIVDRMLAERTISERVRHPGLLDVVVADKSASGVAYLVMEYLEGENLGALADKGRIELDALLAITSQIASALAALHDADVIHCDVKPDNVVVLYATAANGWPKVKVIDYGVARFVDEPPATDSMISGTPSYMAPEQWQGAPTTKTDVYALGCTLFELLVGEPPFQGTLPQLMTAHCEQLPARITDLRSDVPADLERLIIRMLAKDPGMRPTMSEVEYALWRCMPVTDSDDVVLEAVG